MFVKIAFVFLQITACSLQVTRTKVAKHNNLKTQIVFPGPVNDLKDRYGSLNDTDPCADLTYCSVKTDDYPQELFNRIFKGKFKEKIFQPALVTTDNKFGEEDEIDNCASKVSYEPLYKVRSSKMADWQYVAQAPEENFNQNIRLEVCSPGTNSCFTKVTPPIDLETKCVQKLSSWNVLVYDGKGGTELTNVNLPACCSCYFKTKRDT